MQFHLHYRTLVLCTIILLISGCQGDELDYSTVYAGDKIVLNGYIDSDLGCVVNVSKSGPVSGTFDSTRLELTTAHVFLYENGIQIAELQKKVASTYNTKNFTPKEGSSYKISASAPNLPDCESEEILFDSPPQISNVRAQIKPDFKDFRGSKAVSFKFKFDFDSTKTTFFLVRSLADSEKKIAYLVNLTNTNPSCDIFTPEDVYSYADLLGSTKCMKPGSDLEIAVPYQFLFNYPPLPDAKVIKLFVSIIPKSYYDYKQSLYRLSDIEQALLEPNFLYTNIKNGYGVFYSKNTKTLMYKL